MYGLPQLGIHFPLKLGLRLPEIVGYWHADEVGRTYSLHSRKSMDHLEQSSLCDRFFSDRCLSSLPTPFPLTVNFWYLSSLPFSFTFSTETFFLRVFPVPLTISNKVHYLLSNLHKSHICLSTEVTACSLFREESTSKVRPFPSFICSFVYYLFN